MINPLRASVVIPTFERFDSVARLVRQLDEQSLAPEQYEVVVVDDGGSEPIAERLGEVAGRCLLRVITRRNGGPAAARDAGARAASGAVLIMLDDDMQVGSDFVEAHLRHHRENEEVVVLGRILPDPLVSRMPLFERFHAAKLDSLVRDLESGAEQARGTHLYTGNVSLPRGAYLAVGGFDSSLSRSEDRELGLRLQAKGLRFVFAGGGAAATHSSDHTDAATWLRRAYSYGIHDLRIGRKHPTLPDADPWSFMSAVSPIARPLYVASALGPPAGRLAGRLSLGASRLADHLGFESQALSGTTMAYGLSYFAGVGAESGGPFGVIPGLISYLAGQPLSFWREWWAAVKEDHRSLMGHSARYRGEELSEEDTARLLLQKIGLQMMAALRLMQMLRESGRPRAAMALSRLIRHLYGADVHWKAELAPGVMLVHGMGLCMSGEARVGSGCILFQNVTLGEGVDPDSRLVGSPTLEADVHVGPGATILGPVTVGARSKIMAGALVTTSVPPGSLVRAPSAGVEPRPSRGPMERRAPAQGSTYPRLTGPD